MDHMDVSKDLGFIFVLEFINKAIIVSKLNKSGNLKFQIFSYSRVHIRSDEVFSNILKKPSIVK